jgi:hypothetical protein
MEWEGDQAQKNVNLQIVWKIYSYPLFRSVWLNSLIDHSAKLSGKSKVIKLV